MKDYFSGHWKVYAGFAVAAVLLFAVAPAVLSDFRLNLLGKFLCFGIVAVGIGLAWGGRGGMLTLGQGVYFGLGAYIMAMHLKIADAELRGDDVPDFMQIAGIRELPPGYWKPFASPLVTILGILFVPTLIAVLLGLGVFKRKVKVPTSRSCRKRSQRPSRSCSSASRPPVVATA